MEVRQKAGGTTSANDSYTGPSRQITVDTDRHELRVHDGTTAGGHRILNKAQNDLLYRAIGAIVIGDVTGLQSALNALTTSVGLKLPLAGGTMTGHLTIHTDSARINLKSDAGTPQVNYYDNNGILRAVTYYHTGNGTLVTRNYAADGSGTVVSQLIFAPDGSMNLDTGTLEVGGNLVPAPGSQAHGDLLYRGASSWERLAPGSAGETLLSGGAGAAPTWGSAGGIVQMDAQDLTYGSDAAFTGIPAGVKRIDIVFDGLQSTSSQTLIIEAVLGDAGGYETAGYVGVYNNESSINYPAIRANASRAGGGTTSSGSFALIKGEGSHWDINWYMRSFYSGIVALRTGSFHKELSAELTQLKLTVADNHVATAGRVTLAYYL